MAREKGAGPVWGVSAATLAFGIHVALLCCLANVRQTTSSGSEITLGDDALPLMTLSSPVTCSKIDGECLWTADDIEFQQHWSFLITWPHPQPPSREWVDASQVCMPSLSIKYKMRRVMASAQDQWNGRMEYNPGARNHCFFQAVLWHLGGAASASDVRSILWLRRLASKALSAPRFADCLHVVAKAEGMSPQDYCLAVRHQMWGGALEAHAIAGQLGIKICVLDNKGGQLYSAGHGECITLGLHQQHYVALKQREKEEHAWESRWDGDACRGGMHQQQQEPARRLRRIRVYIPGNPIQQEVPIETPAICTVEQMREIFARAIGFNSWHVELTPTTGRRMPNWEIVQDAEIYYAAITWGTEESDTSSDMDIGWSHCMIEADAPLQGERQDLVMIIFHPSGRVEPLRLTLPNPVVNHDRVRGWLAQRMGIPTHLVSMTLCAPQQACWYTTEELFIVVALPADLVAETYHRGGMERNDIDPDAADMDTGEAEAAVPQPDEATHDSAVTDAMAGVQIIPQMPHKAVVITLLNPLHADHENQYLLWMPSICAAQDVKIALATRMRVSPQVVKLGIRGESSWLGDDEPIHDEALKALIDPAPAAATHISYDKIDWQIINLDPQMAIGAPYTTMYAVVSGLTRVQYICFHMQNAPRGQFMARAWFLDQLECLPWQLSVTAMSVEATTRLGIDSGYFVSMIPEPQMMRGGCEEIMLSSTIPFEDSDNEQVLPSCERVREVKASRMPIAYREPAPTPWVVARQVEGRFRKRGYAYTSPSPVLIAMATDDDNHVDDSPPPCQREEILILCIGPSGRERLIGFQQDVSLKQVCCSLLLAPWILTQQLWIVGTSALLTLNSRCLSVTAIMYGQLSLHHCVDVVYQARRQYSELSIFLISPTPLSISLLWKGGMMRHEEILDLAEALTEELEVMQVVIQRMSEQVRMLRQEIEPVRNHGLQNPRDDLQQQDQVVDVVSSEDENDRDVQPFIVRSGPRAIRQFPFYYLHQECVARLHYEYARVARRGAMAFSLRQAGHDLWGWTPLALVDTSVIIEAPANPNPRVEPLSSLDEAPEDWHRGGSPSKLRAALIKKLEMSSSDIPNPKQLVHILWGIAPQALRSVDGPPDVLGPKVLALAKQHDLVHSQAGWGVDVNSRGCKVSTNLGSIDTDAPRKESKKRAGAVSGEGDPEKHATDFERNLLMSSFVDESGNQLVQRARWELNQHESQVTFVSAHHCAATLSQMNSEIPGMLLLDKHEGSGTSVREMRRTQILVAGQDNAKVLHVFALPVAKHRISVVHPAASVSLEADTHCKVTLKLVKHASNEQFFSQFRRKDLLPRFIGIAATDLELKHKKEEAEQDTILWYGSYPRDTILDLLKYSGQYGVQILLARELEDSLKLTPIFFPSDDIHADWTRITHLEHGGVIGPLKNGMALVRAPVAVLAELRQLLLGPRSQFACNWGLVVELRFAAKFPAGPSDVAIVNSLKSSLNWDCVVLSRKSSGRGSVNLVLGAAKHPPHSQVIFEKQVIVLKHLVDQDASPPLPSSFERPVQDTTMGAHASVSSSSAGDLPDVIKQHCKMSFDTIQNRLEQKMVDMEARATEMMQKNAQALKQQAEASSATLQASLLDASKANAQQTIQLAAKVDQLTKDAAQSHSSLDARIQQVADCNDQRAIEVEKRFHKQE